MNDNDRITVHRDERGNAAILRPVGEIDLSRSPSLRLQLREALETRPGRLVIDLTEVSYMDSSGVATFVEAMQHARSVQCPMVLCCLQERVMSIFEIARLDMVFTIVPDVDEALTA